MTLRGSLAAVSASGSALFPGSGENTDCLEQLCAPGGSGEDGVHGPPRRHLTVESGAALGGKSGTYPGFPAFGRADVHPHLERRNRVGPGRHSPRQYRLTDFGRQAVTAMEDAGILVGLSHASPELFWDVAEMARKPLVASHSNAKAICGHPPQLDPGAI